MYIWQVSQQGINSVFGVTTINRFVITSTKRAEDAIFRLQQAFDTEREILNSVKFVGYIPGIAETSQYSRQKIYYVKAFYLQPANPASSLQMKRVVTEFYDQIDGNTSKLLGIEDRVGVIPTGPNDAIDVARIGVVICLVDDDPQSARDIIQSHVFRGAVAAEDIFIEEMRRINAEVI
jgi:hypothetical protein